jgi:hypothetical protein
MNRTEDRMNPAAYADARNLCLKRRKDKQVKTIDTLAQKGNGEQSLTDFQRG